MGILLEDLSRNMSKSLLQTAPKPRMFLQFFRNKKRQDTNIVVLDKKLNGLSVAGIVNPNLFAQGREKLNFNTHTFLLPTLKEAMNLNASDLKNRMFGETVFSLQTNAQKAAVLMAEIQQEQRDLIENRLEIMAIEACFTGQIHVKGKGEDRLIDFNRDPDNTYISSSGLAWNEAGANPSKDIEDFITQIAAKSSANATHLIGRPATMSFLINNTDIKDELNNRRIENGSMAFKSFVATGGATYYGTYKNLELWGYNGNYTDENNVAQKAVPEKQICVLSLDNSNVNMCGYVPDLDVDIQNPVYKATKDARNFVSVFSRNRNSVTVEAIYTGAPMLIDANSTLVATVLS